MFLNFEVSIQFEDFFFKSQQYSLCICWLHGNHWCKLYFSIITLVGSYYLITIEAANIVSAIWWCQTDIVTIPECQAANYADVDPVATLKVISNERW